MAKVSKPSGGKQGGSAGTVKQVTAAVNKEIKTSGLSKTESKFITNMIAQAAKTGKGISNAEKAVIINEAKKQAADKNAAVAKNKTKNIGAFIENEKYKLALNGSTTVDNNLPGGYTPTDTYIPYESTYISSIKLPNRDNVISLDKTNYDVAGITALVFEKLGAVELTKFTRTDTVEGNNPYYNIISNLSSIKKEFDPSNLVSAQKSDDSLYNAFSIKLQNKIPDDNYLAERNLDNYIYIDSEGNLIIELNNITPDELVEIEIDTNGTIVEVRD